MLGRQSSGEPLTEQRVWGASCGNRMSTPFPSSPRTLPCNTALKERYPHPPGSRRHHVPSPPATGRKPAAEASREGSGDGRGGPVKPPGAPWPESSCPPTPGQQASDPPGFRVTPSSSRSQDLQVTRIIFLRSWHQGASKSWQETMPGCRPEAALLGLPPPTQTRPVTCPFCTCRLRSESHI